jgi:hypothetical protein
MAGEHHPARASELAKDGCDLHQLVRPNLRFVKKQIETSVNITLITTMRLETQKRMLRFPRFTRAGAQHDTLFQIFFA